MSILETKHTLSRLNKVKKDLHSSIFIIGCISMMIFLSYNIYLLISNLNNILYLTIYSILIVLMISMFIVEISIKENKKLLKNERRQAKEKKIRYKTTIKIFKFITKSVLVSIAIYETLTNFDVSLSNILNFGSAILLVMQIVYEIFANYVIKQIDYFRLSVELDLSESSAIVKKTINLISPMKKIEEDIIKSQGKSIYSDRELKLIKNIKSETEKYIIEKEQRDEEIKQMLPAKKGKVAFWKKSKTNKKTLS